MSMTREEFEGKWDQTDKKVQAKWQKLTRAERNGLSEHRQKRTLELHEIYGISEEEAERAVAGLEYADPAPDPVSRAPRNRTVQP